MRVLLCGGGTAGHVMPAIAMGEIIESSFPGSEIAFGSRSGGAENKAYEVSGHKLYTVDVRGLKRSLSINNIKSIFMALNSSRVAKDVIKDFNPDLIIGTGGYVCYPFIKAGVRLGIKTVLHESNVAPGLVTRLIGKKCDKVMLNHEETKKHLRYTKNTVTVGNPIRSDFRNIRRSDARRMLGVRDGEILIVSFGGSLGAEILNTTVAEMISRYTLSDNRIRHVHATGRCHFEDMKAKYPLLFRSARGVSILPYIDNMPLYLTAADLAITRSGAITVSELCRSATPSILIPSPNVTGNHQYYNAKHLSDLGAAILIEEKDLTPGRLYSEINSIITSLPKLKSMKKRAAEAEKPDVDGAIIRALTDIMG